MAGRGSRLRPHTLTVPKPLLPIAGKPIVQRIVEDLAHNYPGQIEEIAFIIGDFGKAVEQDLMKIAASLGARGSIYHQDQPLGPAHAIYCAAKSLNGNCIIAFADTLFQANFSFDTNADGIIWVQKVEDPSSYGVVKIDQSDLITDFVEKSPVFVSDLAIVGIYYFKAGEILRDVIKHMMDNQIRDKGEFQITTALELLKENGTQFKAAMIQEWLDCGNKSNVIYTNQRLLDINQDEQMISSDVLIENAIVIPPCYIGQGAVIRHSVVGPHVSLGDNSKVEGSVIVNSVIQNGSYIKDANMTDSMIGNLVEYNGKKSELNLGDYSSYSV